MHDACRCAVKHRQLLGSQATPVMLSKVGGVVRGSGKGDGPSAV